MIEGLERRFLLSTSIAAFGPIKTFTAGGPYLFHLTTADLNGDGKPDVIAANAGGPAVLVLLGNGDGTFADRRTLGAGPQPGAVAVADVNADSKPDILVTNLFGNVSLLLGNGDGSFQARKFIPAASIGPSSMAVGDVNADGKVDVVVTDGTNVAVVLGNGDGTFKPPIDYAANVNAGGAILLADFNGDGRPDVAVTTGATGVLSVLPGNGDGSFRSGSTYALGNGPWSAAASDVNGDGHIDIVCSNYFSDNVSVLLGNGDGTFRPQQTIAAGISPRSVAVADVNVDGKPDIVVSNISDSTLGVMLGNGNGTFQPQKTFDGDFPAYVVVADVNGDTRPDLIAASRAASIGILLGDVPPAALSINRTTPPGPVTTDTSVTYTVTFNEPVTGVDPTDFALALNGVTTTAPVVVSPGADASTYTVTVGGISGHGSLGLNLLDDGSIQDAAGNPLQSSFTGQVYTIEPGVGLLVLDPSGSGALSMSGNSRVVVSNKDAAAINSRSSSSVTINGNAALVASDIELAGGISAKGHATVSGTVDHQDPMPDPLSLPLPTAPSNVFPAVHYSGKGTITLSPGTYAGGIELDGKANVLLLPGVYYLQGGGLQVGKNVSVSGDGVLIINAPGSDRDAIDLQGTVTLAGASSANLPVGMNEYAGIAIFQDPAADAPLEISGGVTIGGSVYVPAGVLSMSGGARLTVEASSAAPAVKVIVYGATLSGNSQLTINPGTGAADPAASTLVSLSSVFSATLVKPSLPTPSQDAGNDNAFEWLGTVDAKA